MDAGQNARIRFTYSLLPNDLSSGPQWTHQWSLRWESETVDVKAYCGNLSGHVSSETDLNMEGKIAQDTAIRQWEQTAQEDFNAKNNFRYKDPGSKNGFEKLNPAEKQIARKIMQAKTHVLKHYPILTDQREITVSSIIQLGSEGLKMQKPDLAILDPALEYPFKPIPNPMGNDGVWEWLPQGTEVTIKSPSDPNSKLSSFQCVDVYLGALSTKKGSEIQYGWDPNFYGGPAGYTVWKLGMA